VTSAIQKPLPELQKPMSDRKVFEEANILIYKQPVIVSKSDPLFGIERSLS